MSNKVYKKRLKKNVKSKNVLEEKSENALKNRLKMLSKNITRKKVFFIIIL